MSKPASRLEAYVKSLDTPYTFKTVDRFGLGGNAEIEIHIVLKNQELDGIATTISALREKISRQVAEHLSIVNSLVQGSTLTPTEDQNFRSINAFIDLMSGIQNAELEFDFKNQKEPIVTKSIRPISVSVVEGSKYKQIIGLVRYFDEASESVTLYHIQDFRGTLNLRVQDPKMRSRLIMAQHDKRSVTLEYIPNFDSTRPDEELNSGVLHEILGTGPSQESITFE